MPVPGLNRGLLFWGLIVAAGLTGCATPAPIVNVPLSPGVVLAQNRSVSIVITNEVDTAYAKTGAAMFETQLGNELRKREFVVGGPAPAMTIEVKITRFEPGNRRERFFVGFGTGQAVLADEVSFRDAAGQILAQFRGGRTLTGDEEDSDVRYASDDGARVTIVNTSVVQICDFIMTNGRFLKDHH